MRVLGIDFGARRLGLAVSEGDVALPVGHLERRDLARDLDALAELARERGVEQLVVGLPVHLDGRRGPEAEAAERFAGRLGARLGLPVHLVDERWTSAEARRVVAPRERRRRRGAVDAAAATLILRTWLESRGAAESAGGGA